MLSIEFETGTFDAFFDDFGFGVSQGSEKNKNLKDYKHGTLRITESKAGLQVSRSHKLSSKEYEDKKGNKVTAKQSFESVLENSPMFENLLAEELNNETFRTLAFSTDDPKELANIAKNLGRRVYVRNANYGHPGKISFEGGVIKLPTIRTGETLDAIEGGVMSKVKK